MANFDDVVAQFGFAYSSKMFNVHYEGQSQLLPLQFLKPSRVERRRKSDISVDRVQKTALKSFDVS